jgi:hypothetical protein
VVVVVDVTVCVDVTVSVVVVVVSVVCASLLVELTTRASATPTTRASINRTTGRWRGKISPTSWDAQRSRRTNRNLRPTDPRRITHFG